MSETPRNASRIPLLFILAAVAFTQLILNRLFVRLLHFEPLAWDRRALRLLEGVSQFVFELVSVLSILLLLAALVRISVWGRHYRAGARLSFPLVGGVTVALAILGVIVRRLPPQWVFHLHLSFLFLGLLVVLTVVSSATSFRFKLGTFFVFAGFALRLAPSMARRYSPLPGLVDANTVDALNAAFFLSVAAASLCFLPRGTSRLAAVITWLSVCGTALFLRRDWEDASRVAAYGFDIELPNTLWGQGLLLLALGFTLNTLVRLLSQPGISRLRGWGLLLLGLGGMQLGMPYEVALASLGMLCLADAAVRPDHRAISREAFETLVKEAAAAVGAPRLTMTGPAGSEVVRLHAPPNDGLTALLTVVRRAGVVDDVEVVVGELPPRDPPLTIERRGTVRLGPRGEGQVVELGDPAFDAAFILRDRRDLGARLLDDTTRGRLLELSRGWVGVWPRAVRYRAQDAANLPQLVALLTDLAKRSSP